MCVGLSAKVVRINEGMEASYIEDVIKKLESGEKIDEKTIIMDEKGFDATTITQDDVDQFGI